MASPLLCYGDDLQLDALADLAVDFDYLSTIERETWLARQWREIAGTMGWLDILELQGGGAGSDTRLEANTARLMAIVGAVVDVVRAVQPSKQLEQEAGLVRAATAEIPKRFIRLPAAQLGGDAR